MANKQFNRREFMQVLGVSALVPAALVIPQQTAARPWLPQETPNINHIGPLEGYTPQIGALVSMLEWISDSVVRVTKKLSVEQLDYLHDKESNSIGALMLHVAATEVIYQDLTFANLSDFSKANKEKWGVAMELGPDAQTKIKGNPVSYYVEAMNEARVTTKKEMKNRKDDWLLGGETKEWNWNNYCKWFHVVEHFANHRGQMTWYAKRMAKQG